MKNLLVTGIILLLTALTADAHISAEHNVKTTVAEEPNTSVSIVPIKDMSKKVVSSSWDSIPTEIMNTQMIPQKGLLPDYNNPIVKKEEVVSSFNTSMIDLYGVQKLIDSINLYVDIEFRYTSIIHDTLVYFNKGERNILVDFLSKNVIVAKNTRCRIIDIELKPCGAILLSVMFDEIEADTLFFWNGIDGSYKLAVDNKGKIINLKNVITTFNESLPGLVIRDQVCIRSKSIEINIEGVPIPEPIPNDPLQNKIRIPKPDLESLPDRELQEYWENARYREEKNNNE